MNLICLNKSRYTIILCVNIAMPISNCVANKWIKNKISLVSLQFLEKKFRIEDRI